MPTRAAAIAAQHLTELPAARAAMFTQASALRAKGVRRKEACAKVVSFDGR